MTENDDRLFPHLSWSKFNSVFPLPASDDAARLANEVKASIDSWIRSSLDQLEKDMNAKAQLSVERLNRQIEASNGALKTMVDEITQLRTNVADLAANDPNLAKKIKDLQEKTETARTAVAEAAKQWEEHGRNAVQTFKAIAGTVATMAG